uniref:glucuronosyltransferase n=1 Tax=Panagrellus redivivus TaxID=6233 RepID=A0A7E4VZR9_PANRE
MRAALFLVAIAAGALFQPVVPAKIAVFNNFFAHSHFAFLSKLADVLSEHGHDVTVVIAEADTAKKHPFPVKAKMMIRSVPPPVNHLGSYEDPVQQEKMWKEQYDFLKQIRNIGIFQRMVEGQCERYLNDSAFVEKVKAEKFEFALIEPTDYCGYGMIKLAGIPVYANSVPMALSGIHARSLGLEGSSMESFPVRSEHYPLLKFLERVWDVVPPFYTTKLKGVDVRTLSVDLVRQYADPEFTPERAIANGRYLFLNTEEHIDFPRPITHKTVYIGGITVAESNPDNLPADYKEIFNNSKKGVVFVSFGSLAKSRYMPAEIKDAFLQLFAAFPEISFIWKYENPSDPIGDHLPNLFKRTWVPQKQLLTHPRLLAFVTHGGMNSALEGGISGVPLLGIPLFADQTRNLRMLEYRDTAVIIDKEAVTAESLIAAMHKLTDTDDYKKRAQELSILAKSNPQSAKERFLTHMEHAIKFAHTKDYLDIGHRELGIVRYYNLDVYAFLSVTVVSLISFVALFVSTLFRLVRHSLRKFVESYRKKTE